MKYHLRAFVLLATILTFTQTALAGAYVTKLIPGTPDPTATDFSLDVPKGKAVAIVNFTCFHSARLFVKIEGVLGFVSTSNTDASQPPFKDIIVCGPATILVDVDDTQQCFLTYRLFAN